MYTKTEIPCIKLAKRKGEKTLLLLPFTAL
jgi:hypothetical protein